MPLKRFSLPRWTTSFLLVTGSAVYLMVTLRGVGPRGNGVDPMLQMQSAWESAPAIHATGTIRFTSAGRDQLARFELWEARGYDRKLIVTRPNDSAITVVHNGRAERSQSGRRVVMDPEKDPLFPVIDPDCGEAYFRWAKLWKRMGTETVEGRRCLRIEGTAPNAIFFVDLDQSNHLPTRTEIRQPGGKDGYEVDFTTLSVIPALPSKMFDLPGRS